MKRKLVASLVLAVMFAAGWYGGSWWARRPLPMQARSMTPGSTVLADALGLSEPQRLAVDSILLAGQPAIDSVSRAAQERLRLAIDSLEGEIRRLLDPDQQRRLDSLRAEVGLPLATGARLRQPGPPPPSR